MTRVDWLADGIAVPFRYHWYVVDAGAGSPETLNVRVASWPLVTVWETGSVAATGA
jgi:hypothetical protein